jgi:hypothetical protein
MTYPPELQAYYDAHDRMMNQERTADQLAWWPVQYGYYKVARYNAVKAGYLPETPEFG